MGSMYQEHGKKLKRLIRDAGLDQKEVAVRVDVSPQAVSGWTTGKSPPKLPMLLKLDRVLGGDGRVFAIYGEAKPRAIDDIVIAAMEAGLSEIRSAVDVLETSVTDEVRSQLVEHDGRLLEHEGRLRELTLEVRTLALRVFGDPGGLSDPELGESTG